MKKNIILMGMIIICVVAFSACNVNGQVKVKSDYQPGIMYNGNIYVVTDNVFDPTLIGEELGVITSVIDGSDGMPKKEFQTNGYKVDEPIYYYGEDGLYIAVFSNDVYVLLKKIENDEFTINDYKSIKVGTMREEVLKEFGDPDGMLSGLYGDIYFVGDLRVIIYYEFNEETGSPVESIKIVDLDN